MSKTITNSTPAKAGTVVLALRPWLLLAAGLLVSVLLSLEVKKIIEEEAIHQFAFASDQITLKVQERLAAYALTLKGGAGLFAASKSVERNEWRDYVKGLRVEESVPGVQGIGFSLLIPAEKLSEHIASVRKQGFPDYTVRPEGARGVYSAIIYLEPFRDRNLRAFGFDMFSEATRRAAMEQARDSGEVALSGKVKLVQETNKGVQAGTLMYVPVYRNGAKTESVEQRRAALIGWSYSPYRMNDLMIGVLSGMQQRDQHNIELHIYDGVQTSAPDLLFSSDEEHQVNRTLFEQQRSVKFGGRHWTLVFDHKNPSATLNYSYAWASLLAGFALSGLIFWLRVTIINTRSKAISLAEGLTEKLRRSNADLQRFSEVTAHHLQEPARRIASYSDRLRMQLDEKIKDEDAEQSLIFIRQEARRQQNLLRDTERYLAADQPRGKVERIDANTVVDAVLRKLKSRIDAASVEITVAKLPSAYIDANRLSDLFEVAIDNALVHGKERSPLIINIVGEPVGNFVRYSVSDNGPGIEAQYRERVFRVFERLSTMGDGTGIGLAIVRRIVESCGGRVWIEESPQGGCRILFELPTKEL
ncbi:MAG: CHASE domain-containing protein [Gallionellaceae bacterium]